LIDPLKSKDRYGAQRRLSWGILWQDVERLVQDVRCTVSLLLGRRGTTLMNPLSSHNAPFRRQSPENYSCLAMKDVFDLSLTWDDLEFLRAAHIQPSEALKQGAATGRSFG
jgi:hypothetical protein